MYIDQNDYFRKYMYVFLTDCQINLPASTYTCLESTASNWDYATSSQIKKYTMTFDENIF